MKDRNLEARRQKVLRKIVRFYIDSAEPVGSKLVSDEMGLSSATVRNIMADLEKMGLIIQPYTSAGRVPTEKGYRFFVDFLMEPEDISEERRQNIELIYNLEPTALEGVIEESSRILSSISTLTAVITFPGVSEDKLYFDGAYHILEQPEFRDPERVRLLFKTIEEKSELLDLFREDLAIEGAHIRIGSENRSFALSDCSTISASYMIDGNHVGTIGILGPTRMEYSKLVSLVDYLAKTITGLLTKSF